MGTLHEDRSNCVAASGSFRVNMPDIFSEVAKAGGEIRHVFAHRQTNGNKPACPGETIWKNVALWAQKELGLVSDPGYTKGSGLPIPNVWDSRSSHKY